MPRIHSKKHTHPPSTGRSSRALTAPGGQKNFKPKRDLRSGDVVEIEAPERLSGVLVLNHNFEPLNICSIQRV